jgi:hypothetical protein
LRRNTYALEERGYLDPDRRGERVLSDVRFSNRPAGVKRFQTVHGSGVDVTCGFVLLYGVGT